MYGMVFARREGRCQINEKQRSRNRMYIQIALAKNTKSQISSYNQQGYATFAGGSFYPKFT